MFKRQIKFGKVLKWQASSMFYFVIANLLCFKYLRIILTLVISAKALVISPQLILQLYILFQVYHYG